MVCSNIAQYKPFNKFVMADIRRVTIPRETAKAYLVRQKIRGSTVEEWVPQAVVPYKKKHTPVTDNPDTQEYDLCIDDWWLEKTESELQ